jgi:CheY-like chemotaxis protein
MELHMSNQRPTLEQQLAYESPTEDTRTMLQRARSPLHILVVDDDPVTHRLIRSLLGINYHITECTNVGSAVSDYLRVQPDLVFLDIDLGDNEFNGFDVAHTICMYDNDANIIMLTAHESPQNVAHAIRSGASRFLSKPFGASHILSFVQECEREKLERE